MLKKLKWALHHAPGNRNSRYYNVGAQATDRHRRIVTLLSAGNVNLQRGRYITSDMIDQKRERLLGAK